MSVWLPDSTTAHFGAQELHTKDVERLALDIFLAHEDLTLHAEARRHRGGGHAMLSGAGLGDDAPLAHVPRQEDLAHGVVDLMRAGVTEILALEIDRRAAQAAGQSFGEIERCFPADILFEIIGKLAFESAIPAHLRIAALQFDKRRHEGFRHIAPAVGTEMAAPVRHLWQHR